MTKWLNPTLFPKLNQKILHIWRISIENFAPKEKDLFQLLNPQEKERANQFLVKEAATNFIISRAILRTLIAKYLDNSPQKIVLHQNKYGKLYLNENRLKFNLSHSRGLAVMIFALDTEVGIDVEYIRQDFECLTIAQRFFSDQEIQDLLYTLDPEKPLAFFNCWSRKEAVIKALGSGLFTELDSFSVEVFSKKTGPVNLSFNKKTLTDFSLYSFDPGSDHSGAFALADTKLYQTNYFEFDDRVR